MWQLQVHESGESYRPLRPQSAEMRPGSSQLSRFAEHLPDTSASWPSTGNVDKLFFSMLPELDHNSFWKDNSDFLNIFDVDWFISSLSKDVPVVKRVPDKVMRSMLKPPNTMRVPRKSEPDYYLDEVLPILLRRRVVTLTFYTNVNSAAGIWYRGPPGGPAYGPPVAPGGFPLEPFPYYRPQMPPPALGNSHPVIQQVPVAGPRGHYLKNGNF